MNAVRAGRVCVRRLVAQGFDSGLGRRLLGSVAVERPDLLLGSVGYWLATRSRLSAIDRWPAELGRFEDVAPLVLSSNPANRGLASMSLVEIARLWTLATNAGPALLIEIGRERGGRTLVLAAAMARGATLYSFDPQTKLSQLGDSLDSELASALARYDLAARVHLSRDDSHTVEPPAGRYALVLVDGDPSLEGTRSDFARFCLRLQPGGHALFHDAAAGGPRHLTLKPLMAEIEGDARFARLPDVGTFVEFQRLPGD